MSQETAGRAARHSQLPEPLRSAVLAHEAGKLDAAYPLYREFVKDNPKHPTALQLFGLLLSQIRQYEPAITLMREALRLFPEQPEVANNLGNALLKAGRPEEAARSYAEAVRLLPDYVDAMRNLGIAQARLGRYDEARACLGRCLECRPDDPLTHFALGNTCRDAGDFDAAIAAFGRALELKPGYAQAHHNLGVCLRLAHRPEAALEHLEAAAKLGLDGFELYHNLGNAFIDLQQAEDAIAAYKEALRRNPLDPDTHRNLNALLWEQEHLDEHLESYRLALKANPAAEPLRLAWAAALNQKEAYAEAERVLREGFPHSGETSQAKSLIAYTMEQQDRWDEALKMHAYAVDTRGSVPNHRISYARALLARGRPDQAEAELETARRDVPDNQRALAYLGLCWRLSGDERDAWLNDYANMVRPYDIPVPAGFADADAFNRRLAEVLKPLHIGKRHPAEQTLRGGSQTSGNLFDRREPEIRALIESLRHCIADYVARFPDDGGHPLYGRRGSDFEFAASWSVRLRRNGYHSMHTHPLGWISSAYYVEVPPAVSESDAVGGGLQFGRPDIDIGAAGEPRLELRPVTGRLVLFPSYMWHGTLPFEADEPRMTVAFDVVPVA